MMEKGKVVVMGINESVFESPLNHGVFVGYNRFLLFFYYIIIG